MTVRRNSKMAWSRSILLSLLTAMTLGNGATLSAQIPDSHRPDLQRDVTGNLPRPSVRSGADLQSLQTRVQRAIAAAMNATVSVKVGQEGSQRTAFGSGVIISEDGYVLTAAHVSSRPNQTVEFRMADGRTARGVTLGLQQDLDMGLMKITDTGPWYHIKRSRSDDLAAGDWVIALGHPGNPGLDPSNQPLVRLGRVLKASPKALLTDCTLHGGDSGGPLIDLDGKVVGIHSRIGSDLTTNLHVPIDRFAENWNRLAAKESWGALHSRQPWIGVEHDRDSVGARIKSVREGSPAQLAGLQPGDVILKFASERVSSFDDLKQFVADQEPGRPIPIRVQRGDAQIDAMLEVGTRESRHVSQTRDDADLLKDWLNQIEVRRRRGRAIVGIGKNSDQVKEAFHDALTGASKLTVEILDAASAVSLGTIVSEDLILTKASRLEGANLRARFRGSRSFRVDLVSESKSHDLALLKAAIVLPFENLTVAEDVQPGTLLASSSMNVWPLAVGVASSTPRPVPSEGKLGIGMYKHEPRVSHIVEDSGADSAGVELYDLVVGVNDQPIQTPEQLIELVASYYPGDVLSLSVQRDGKVLEFPVKLSRNSDFDEALAEFEDFVGGELSDRRTGFRIAQQHDTPLGPNQCGGPVVDARGRFVGINIARAARTTSLLLPASEVMVALRELQATRNDLLKTVDVGRDP